MTPPSKPATKPATQPATKPAQPKIDPKDISVMFGAPMTEEEFAEYRKKNTFKLLRGSHK